MFARATHQLHRLGVNVKMNEDVKRLTLEDQHVSITTSQKSQYTCKKIYLSRHTILDSISSGSAVFVPAYFERTSSHHVFSVKNCPPLGFHQFSGRFPLVFLNDVTQYVPESDKLQYRCRVLCSRSAVSRQMRIEEVVNSLKSIGCLPAAADVIQSRTEIRHVKKINDSFIEEVKSKLGSHIDFLLSDDLSVMRSIAGYANQHETDIGFKDDSTLTF
jgi:hypothetical protein